MQRMPYIFDPKLIPRVQKYLEANVDKTYVDIGLMADELQNTYREYSRRKRNAFRQSVKKAYSVVLRSYGLDDQNDTSSEEEVEEAESDHSKDDRSYEIANNQLVELYSRSSVNVPKMNENELIDISSDDSKDENQQLPPKASNGPSTSLKVIRTDFAKAFSRENKEKHEKPTVIQGKKRKIEDKILPLQVSKKKKLDQVETIKIEVPVLDFKDVVGIDDILIEIRKHFLAWMTVDSNDPYQLGFLFHGPSGCGKSLLAHAIAGEYKLPLIKIAAPELVDGISGNSEKLIRELFKRAQASSPCVLFIDNIEAITHNTSQKDMQRRIVAQLNGCLDELERDPAGKKVVLIATTSNIDTIDPTLRGYDRFSREIRLGIPNEEGRMAILKHHSWNLNFEPNFNWKSIAEITPGYVGGDLRDLIKDVRMTAVSRFIKENKDRIMNDNSNVTAGQNEIKRGVETEELDKNEPEIIVDDDPREVIKDKKNSLDDENPVLVIDDENSKQEDEDISSSTQQEVKNSEETKLEEKVTEEKLTEDVAIENPIIIEQVKDSLTGTWTLNEITEISTVIREKGPNSNLLKDLCITENDFLEAVEKIKPLSIRSGLCSVPKINWEDVGSLQGLKEELMRTVQGAIKYRKQYKKLGLNVPAGVMLCGPPGCGKTLLAKAMANQAQLNFFSVRGPELLNMYVGESEKAVRMCFERAKNAAPCVIFFDEIDALCPKRSSKNQSEVSSRVVAQLLTEMDGVSERKGVFILAATNRPDIVEPAVLRPGRFDKILYVDFPNAEDRVSILKTITRKGPALSGDVDLESIGKSEKLSGYTGADLAALIKEAAHNYVATHDDLENSDLVLSRNDFEKAISRIIPSVSEKDRAMYAEMKQLYTPPLQNEVNEQMDLS